MSIKSTFTSSDISIIIIIIIITIIIINMLQYHKTNVTKAYSSSFVKS